MTKIILLVVMLFIGQPSFADRTIDVERVFEIRESFKEQLFSDIGEPDPLLEVIESPIYNEEDLYWLSRIISAESRGESEEGQIAVGNVVMNRVNSDKFPDTIKDVIFQKNQFCPVGNGSVYNEPTEQAVISAKKVLDGQVIVGDAIYFYAPRWTSSDNWIRTRTLVSEIGVHRFAK